MFGPNDRSAHSPEVLQLDLNGRSVHATRSRRASRPVARADGTLRLPPAAGFTLLELMIVLIILVTVMAVSWPRITGQMQLVAPREAALQLKSDLAEARERAVIGGEAWCVRIQRGSGKYEVAAVSTFRQREVLSPQGQPTVTSVDALLLSDVHAAQATSSTPTNSDVLQDSAAVSSNPAGARSGAGEFQQQIESLALPAGMNFDDGVAHATQDANLIRTNEVMQSIPVSPSQIPASPATLPVASPSVWKYVVVFQPDGRATEAEIRLREATSGATIRLRIRGFTGGVTIDPVERRKANAPGTPSDDYMPDGALIPGDQPDPFSSLPPASDHFRSGQSPLPAGTGLPAAVGPGLENSP